MQLTHAVEQELIEKLLDLAPEELFTYLDDNTKQTLNDDFNTDRLDDADRQEIAELVRDYNEGAILDWRGKLKGMWEQFLSDRGLLGRYREQIERNWLNANE